METKRKKKKWPWVLLAIIVVLAAGVAIIVSLMPSAEDMAAYDSYTVVRGSITSTITGSGKLEASDTQNIDAPDGIVVSDILVQAGDSVKAGDTLATLDIGSIQNRIAYLTEQLASLDAELSRMSGATVEYVYAPVKGRLKYLPISEGSGVVESIMEYGSLAVISADGLMQLEIATAQSLTISDDVTVKWEDGSADGLIAEKTAGGYLITLDDAKAPYLGSAQVYDGDALLGKGTLEIHSPIRVYANGGTVSEMLCEVGDKVNPNTKLFALKNQPFISGYQQTYSDRLEMASQLDAVFAYLSDRSIVAIEDGIIGSVNIAEGDEVGGSQSSSGASGSSMGSAASTAAGTSTAFVVKIGGALKMRVSADELDIRSISLG